MGSSESSLARRLLPLREDLWTIRGPFRFLNLAEIGGYGVIAKVNQTDSSNVNSSSLAVINPVQLTASLLAEVRRLEEEAEAPLKVIYSPGDWHHVHLMDWGAAFPDAALYVASERVLKKQPKLRARGARVVDQTRPVVPELGAGWTLIPWLGSKQPPWLLGGDPSGSDRIEQLCFHTASQTLFVTDHLFAPKVRGPEAELACNKGGFSIKDPAAIAASCRRVMQLGVENLIFSHGTERTFSVSDADAAKDGTPLCGVLLRRAYERFFIKQGEGGGGEEGKEEGMMRRRANGDQP